MGKLKLSQISYPVVHCENLDKLLIFQLERAKVVSHVGNIWIGPWANFPHYMDPTFSKLLVKSVLIVMSHETCRVVLKIMKQATPGYLATSEHFLFCVMET